MLNVPPQTAPHRQHTPHSLLLIRKKPGFFLYITLKRWHHILQEKLSWLISTALCETLSKSYPDSSWLPLVPK